MAIPWMFSPALLLSLHDDPQEKRRRERGEGDKHDDRINDVVKDPVRISGQRLRAKDSILLIVAIGDDLHN